MKISTLVFFFLLCTLFSLYSYAYEVRLTWDHNHPLPEGYNLYQRHSWDSYDYDFPVWKGTENICAIYNLVDDTIYCFTVRAFVEEDESGDSNEVCIRRNGHDGGVVIEVGVSSGGGSHGGGGGCSISTLIK